MAELGKSKKPLTCFWVLRGCEKGNRASLGCKIEP